MNHIGGLLCETVLKTPRFLRRFSIRIRAHLRATSFRLVVAPPRWENLDPTGRTLRVFRLFPGSPLHPILPSGP